MVLENLKLSQEIDQLARKLEIVQTDNDVKRLKEQNE